MHHASRDGRGRSSGSWAQRSKALRSTWRRFPGPRGPSAKSAVRSQLPLRDSSGLASGRDAPDSLLSLLLGAGTAGEHKIWGLRRCVNGLAYRMLACHKPPHSTNWTEMLSLGQATDVPCWPDEGSECIQSQLCRFQNLTIDFARFFECTHCRFRRKRDASRIKIIGISTTQSGTFDVECAPRPSGDSSLATNEPYRLTGASVASLANSPILSPRTCRIGRRYLIVSDLKTVVVFVPLDHNNNRSNNKSIALNNWGPLRTPHLIGCRCGGQAPTPFGTFVRPP